MKKEFLIFGIIVAVLVFYIGDRCGEIYRTSEQTDVISKIGEISDNTDKLYNDIRLSTNIDDLKWGAIGFFGVALVFLYGAFSRKNYRVGEEHGSATWGTPADIAKFIDSDPDKNMILTMTEKMSLNGRKHMRNCNILVIGGSGSGKTRFFLKPNLMQMHSSYVITDPKGTVILECGKMLADNGYNIKTLNLIDFNKSMKYNPFKYITAEKDIIKLADLIIKNCGDKSEKQDFWVKAEKLLYQALIGYVYYEYPEEKQNFASVLEMINDMEVREDDEEFKNSVDLMFMELELGTEEFCKQMGYDISDFNGDIRPPNPEHYAVKQYKKYKLAAGKTAKSILISCGVRLSAFDIEEVRKVTEKDEMELDLIGDVKTALFIIIDDTSSTFNFLAGMLYTQLFNTLCNKADNKYNGSLPIHVRCLLDEFANIGQIPDFEKLIATIRSRNISADVILQNMAQLKGLYDKQAGTIAGNCDTTLFLGSSEAETIKMISEKVGKTTIDHKGSSTTKGQNGSYSTSEQIIARDLITPDEVGKLPRDTCLLFINGVKPFMSKKFKIESHKNYKLLSDFDKKNTFDIVEYNKQLEEKRKAIDKEFDIAEDLEVLDDVEVTEEKDDEFDVIINSVESDIS